MRASLDPIVSSPVVTFPSADKINEALAKHPWTQKLESSLVETSGKIFANTEKPFVKIRDEIKEVLVKNWVSSSNKESDLTEPVRNQLHFQAVRISAVMEQLVR